MIASCLLLAAALSAGNAEFEDEARETAAMIAVMRLERDLSEKGLDAGILESAMLADPVKYKIRGDAENLCRDLYAERVFAKYTNAVARIRADLALGEEPPPAPRTAFVTNALIRHYAAAFARERASACAAQAKSIALKVKPDEADLESKGDEEARTWLTSRIAYAKGMDVFEENLQYISEKIVDPLLADARKERKRQQEYLMRTRTDAMSPTALAKELEANLRKNVAERQAKCDDPQRAWSVFPRILREDLPTAVTRRILSQVVKEVEDVPLTIAAEDIRTVFAANPSAHRKLGDSEKIFREQYASRVLAVAVAKLEARVPEAERAELVAFLKERATTADVTKAVDARVRRELLPKWRQVRAEIAETEVTRLWPTLADRTWYPSAELADQTVARSDYGAVLKDWRKAPELQDLAGKTETLEESEASADKSVAAAFDLARTAIAAQNEIVGKSHPLILTAAKDLSKGLFSKKPNLAAVTEMLMNAVTDGWAETREETLWKDGKKPANADEQHAALFPSVKRRIELEARQILDELEQQESKEKETKETPPEEPPPEEPPPEEPPVPSEETPEEELCTISFSMAGGEVTVQAKRGNTVVAERKAKATASGFENALREVGAVVGREIFRLK